jgi:hypothetical protein
MKENWLDLLLPYSLAFEPPGIAPPAQYKPVAKSKVETFPKRSTFLSP